MTNATAIKETKQVSQAENDLPVYTPAVEIYQNAECIALVAEMPGVDESSVEITLEKGTLTIEGKASRDCFDGFSVVRSEAPLGNYKRIFRLAEDIDSDKVEAIIKNGVLKLMLPIHEKAKPKTIKVKAE